MLPTELAEFAEVLKKTWRFYGKTITPETVADWHDVLEDFPLSAVRQAFKRHLTDTERGQYLPKPADIIRFLMGDQVADGRPSGDEAWGYLLRLIRNEHETGVMSDEMRAAWAGCQSILDAGDEIGARRCFLDVYARAVSEARRQRQAARWTVTLGTDLECRKRALQEAVAVGRISADYAQTLLPAPTANLEHLAGLLEHDGPKPEPGQPSYAERLRSLIANACSSAPRIDPVQAEQERQLEIEARKPPLEPPLRRAA